MRNLLTWILMLGLLAGTHARAFAGVTHPLVDAAAPVATDCCHLDSCAPSQADPSHEGDTQGKEGHHHHHQACCCFHGQPLTMETDALLPPALPSRLLPVAADGARLPDEPVLGSEKPPLI